MSKGVTLLLIILAFNVINIDGAKINKTNTPSNYETKINSIPNTENPGKISGKWQVGRVSRKQYEIINMLWKKTKTFIETETSDPPNYPFRNGNIKVQKSKHVTLVHQNPVQESFQVMQPRHRPLTPSYIEFYYLDEFDERIKHNDTDFFNNDKVPRAKVQNDDYKVALLRPPFFIFRVNDATCKPTTLNLISTFIDNKKGSTKHTHEFQTNYKRNSKQKANSFQKDNTKAFVTTKGLKYKNRTDNITLASLTKDRFTARGATTNYDRIKFFEIYDSETFKPHTLKEHTRMSAINDNYIQNDEKIYLDQVDHDTGNHDDHNFTRFVKKHVDLNKFNDSAQDKSSQVNLNGEGTTRLVTNARRTFSNMSRPAKWSDYSFVAVYVYEPTQVRCDSAAISDHWLVASAACLFRHHKDIKTEGRSAFVAYCGGNWRLPGRIAYVKQSFIHPRYQPKDNGRKYLYNIGVIQVVNSMATTCNRWRPISLMSHQFVASSDGTLATAIGWGLDRIWIHITLQIFPPMYCKVDLSRPNMEKLLLEFPCSFEGGRENVRYDMKYSASDTPNYPLMVYEGLVYSHSCPGNSDYSTAKMLNEEIVKNIHCLTLPPYTSEENDSVHGGLLLIGEKLIALYLQEERRRWGEQSAQYTGIWRLIPWLLQVAHEADDFDTFISGI